MLQGCIFWLPMHLLEVCSPVFLWCHDHKGVLSVRDNFYRSRREPLHPFPAKARRSPLKVTQEHAEQSSVPLPFCLPAFPWTISLHTLVSQQVPCDRRGAPIQPSWMPTEPKTPDWRFLSPQCGLSVVGFRGAAGGQCRACGKDPHPHLKCHAGTSLSQVFGLHCAMPPSKPRCVLSSKLSTIPGPQGSPLCPQLSVPKEGTVWKGCAPVCGSLGDD